jgi:Peptidase family M41
MLRSCADPRGLRHALTGSVGTADFDAAVLRSVAGIEKKRSILQGVEKSTVARHEAGHALLSTAVAALIPGAAQVEKLSIIPRSGGALGCDFTTPSSSCSPPTAFSPTIRRLAQCAANPFTFGRVRKCGEPIK